MRRIKGDIRLKLHLSKILILPNKPQDDGILAESIPKNKRNEAHAEMLAFIQQKSEESIVKQKKRIFRNLIRCKHCLEEIESESVHDMKYCQCGKVGIDGGKDYLKRTGSPNDYWEISIIEETTF